MQLSTSKCSSLIHWVCENVAILPSNCRNHCCSETAGPFDIWVPANMETVRGKWPRCYITVWHWFGRWWKLLGRELQWAGGPEQRQVALHIFSCFSRWERHRSPFQNAEIHLHHGNHRGITPASLLLPTVETLIGDSNKACYFCWTYRTCRRSIKISKNYLSLVFCVLGKNTVCHHPSKNPGNHFYSFPWFLLSYSIKLSTENSTSVTSLD